MSPWWYDARKLRTDKEAERRALYDAGMSDRQIGAQLGLDRTSIRLWRKSRSLPAIRSSSAPTRQWGGPLPAIEEARRRTLYDRGMSDLEIAGLLDLPRNTIRQWRRARKLRGNAQKFSVFTYSAKSVERLAIYELGCSDQQIAEKLGEHTATVKSWRQRRRLPAHPHPRVRSAPAPRVRSLDAAFTFGAWSLHDVLADASHVNWLEEMGATCATPPARRL